MITKRALLFGILAFVMLGLLFIFLHKLVDPQLFTKPPTAISRQLNKNLAKLDDEVELAGQAVRRFKTIGSKVERAANQIRAIRIDSITREYISTLPEEPKALVEADDFERFIAGTTDKISASLDNLPAYRSRLRRSFLPGSVEEKEHEFKVKLAEVTEPVLENINALSSELLDSLTDDGDFITRRSLQSVEIRKHLAEYKPTEIQDQALLALDLFNDELKAAIDDGVKNETETAQFRTDLEKEVDGLSNQSNDRLVLTMVLPIFSIIVILLLAIPYLYRSGQGGETKDVFIEIFSRGLLLKIFTVFILTIAIMILGIGGQISGETLGTLLGAISAYVLQSSFSKEKDLNPTAETNAAETTN